MAIRDFLLAFPGPFEGQSPKPKYDFLLGFEEFSSRDQSPTGTAEELVKNGGRHRLRSVFHQKNTCAFPISRCVGAFPFGGMIVLVAGEAQDVVDGVSGSGVRTGHDPQRFHLQAAEAQHRRGVVATFRFHHAVTTDWKSVSFWAPGGRFQGGVSVKGPMTNWNAPRWSLPFIERERAKGATDKFAMRPDAFAAKRGSRNADGQ